jgi:hypothetical protein
MDQCKLNLYLVKYIDNYSKFTIIYLKMNKSKVFSVFLSYKAYAENKEIQK